MNPKVPSAAVQDCARHSVFTSGPLHSQQESILGIISESQSLVHFAKGPQMGANTADTGTQ